MNKRNILILFAFTFIAVLLFFHMINLQTPSLANASSMPTDVNRQTYSVTGYDMIKEQDGVTIRFTDTPVDIELALTLSDMGTYQLFINDRELFSYEKQSIFSRSHCIAIPISYLRNDGVLTIYFQSDSWGKRTAEIVTGRLNAPPKVLIGPASSAEKANRSSSETIYFMIGMCILLTGSSLLLFFYRMEEISFLLLSLVALLRAFTMIINVPDSIFSLSMELYYLIRPTLVTCPVIFHAAMGIYLLKDAIPKQAMKYFSPFTLLTLTAFALFLQQISSRNWYHMIQAICFGFFFWIAYRACRQKIQGSQLLMAGYAAAAAIILYVYLVNVFYIAPAGQLLTSISITHFSYMITLLSCMACIDIRLIRQFHKVETLSAELVEINQELDSRVIERTNQLVESQQQKQRIMMNIFHDLRNPVFVMKGCLHNISAENSKQKRYKELAETRLAQLEKMVEDLFLAEKLETGQLLLCEEHVFLPNLMRTVADSARISASVNSSVSLFIETECFVWGDSLRLLQAFQNLTENALSHLPQNGQLTISLRQEGNHAVCLFTDNGSGIPTEDLPHIFERYYTSASSRKNTATGLGLSIANELIRLHGGTISVQSKPQYGTTFTVIIPCTTPPHDLEEAFRWE